MLLPSEVKQLSAKQGKSLQKVSEELGFGVNYLYQLKNQQPTAEKLTLIADYFDVSVDYLLGRVKHDNEEAFTKIFKDMLLPSEVKKLIKFADKFNDNGYDDLEYELLEVLTLAVGKSDEYTKNKSHENAGVEFKQFVKTLNSVVKSFYDGPIDLTEESHFGNNKSDGYFSTKRKKINSFDRMPQKSSIDYSKKIAKEAADNLPKPPKTYRSPLERTKQDDNDD